MKIVMTGGGSGGHITPILAVAHELKQLYPEAEIIFIGQTGDAYADLTSRNPNIDKTYAVSAGKFRRYADEGWLKRLTDFKTILLNIRDGYRVARGTWQSYQLLRTLKLDIIFTRGGFVSVPVAIGGRLNHIPYITHDSDSTPSLANRLIARWAAMHAVALPKELYPYPARKTVTVGVPVSNNYEPVTPALKRHYRKLLKLDQFDQVVFATGGGNGARLLNEALVEGSRYLLSAFPRLAIVHISGPKLEDATNAAYNALQLGSARERVQVLGFVNDMYRYSGAADVVVGRAGASTFAEFAIQGVACVMVPPKQLIWAVKNSRDLASRNAIVELNEDQVEQPERLGHTIGALLQDDAQRAKLAKNLAGYAHPHAAADLAKLILRTAGGKADART
jgi:UDP-N-acetylglucosamine--N-acetylmuramyl-(pentapeptide) pyrophosphoryl-undecaprenol N-acetylglucosamine transferase